MDAFGVHLTVYGRWSEHCPLRKFVPNSTINVDRGHCLRRIHHQGARICLLVDRECSILVGIKSGFHLLYHDPTSAVHNVGAIEVCCYFVEVVPLKMKHIIAIASNNLRSELCGNVIHSFRQWCLMFQAKVIGLTSQLKIVDWCFLQYMWCKVMQRSMCFGSFHSPFVTARQMS